MRSTTGVSASEVDHANATAQVAANGLPNLVIIGERRSGTTWLSQLIARHPAIFVHPKRDRAFFIEDDARKRLPTVAWESTHTVDDYRSMFARFDTSGYAQICEKSADYLFWRPAHERLAQFLPDARYIAILRHPVRRAWSHYWIEVGKRREFEDFNTALALENERGETEPYYRNHLSYRARGFYDDSIAHFLSLISIERLHVLTLEELISDQTAVMRGVFSFLGLEEISLPGAGIETQNRNWVMTTKPSIQAAGLAAVAKGYASGVDFALKLFMRDRDRRRRVAVTLKSPLFDAASNAKMDSACVAALTADYAPHVRRLEQILGRSFAHWRL